MAEINHPTVVERYFTPRFRTDVNKSSGEDMQILTHTNKISLITLAPSHPILQDKKTVTKVDFQVDKQTNRLQNKVTGKSKRGAQSVSLTAPLCHVICSDQSRYTIPACMKGSLVEVNENLVKNPDLITRKPSTEGYIAILLTHLQDHKAAMAKLLTQEQYDAVLRHRQQQADDTEPGGQGGSDSSQPQSMDQQHGDPNEDSSTQSDIQPGEAVITEDSVQSEPDGPPSKIQKLETT